MQRDSWALVGGGVLAAGIGAGIGALAYRQFVASKPAAASSPSPAPVLAPAPAPASAPATADTKAGDSKSPFPAFVKGATAYDFDLFVIGGGSGGVATARRAADQGAKVGIAESSRLGGTCVNVGCVPKKLYMYASQFRDEFKVAADGYGWDLSGGSGSDAKLPVLSWKTVHDKVVAEVKRLNGVYRGMLDSRKIPVFTARATVVDAHTVEVRDVDPNTGVPTGKAQRFTAERILIATGSYAFTPADVPGIEHAVTSNALFEWETLPKRVVIVGGGYIGTEFAGILNGTGLCDSVVQVVRSDSILNGFDVDLRVGVTKEMRDRGIDIRTHTDVVRIENNAKTGGVSVHTRDRQTKAVTVIDADVVLYAAGRLPLTKGLGLEAAGVKLTAKGAVAVNEYSQTNVPSIFAVGDVTDRVMLTPVAIAEGRALVANLYRGLNIKLSYRNVPTAVFSQPEIGTVGLSEDDALKQFGAADVDLYRTKFRPMKYSLASTSRAGQKVKDENVVMKLVVHKATQKVVGAHMMGSSAAELAQILGVAINTGATKQQFDTTIALHPSAAEEFVLLLDTVPPTVVAPPAAAAAAAGGAAK